ncbi:MAG: hypothetical protein ACI4CE_07350 [Methanomethylophilus alvi]
MTKERMAKVARWATTDEVQKWASNVGRFAADAHKAVASLMKVACDACPFRNMINVGGCLSDDCPIHLTMHTVNRAAPRAANATKGIYKEKYK